MNYYRVRKQNIPEGKDEITDMIMKIFDNHKIELKFADLLRDDWQSLRERCTHNKISLDKIAESYFIWKSSGR